MPMVPLPAGRPQRLGAHCVGAQVNFALYSLHAERVELCVLDASGRREISSYDLLEGEGGVWHGSLPRELAEPGTRYAYRVHGPWDPALGHRFDATRYLVDPYARRVAAVEAHAIDAAHAIDVAEALAVAGASSSIAPAAAVPPLVPAAMHSPPCVGVVADSDFDWQSDRPPAVPWRDSLIYELHVKGFTQLHPRVPQVSRGKYVGLTAPAVIEHLQGLGVTAMELLPCQAFLSEDFLMQKGLRNYWGYNSLAWFAPAPEYALDDPVVEFKTMVRELHKAGIEVILDVVFNHTAEGNDGGPTYSLKGIDNSVYYRLFAQDLRYYENLTGCGNTVNCEHPQVRLLIIECMRYWVEEMHVDGFRFDLAPVLARTGAGFDERSQFFAAVRAEAALAYVKLIAEPWDVGLGGYQLGHFPAGWSEWNDHYRDSMRSFWRGDGGKLGEFAERFAGSSDIFRHRARRPSASINLITAHDGFTLNDLVSYNDRHNEANLENNADGHSHNLSWNCGVEGPTDDVSICALRLTQMKNLLATLLLSQGVPMMQAGDEFARTQRGNNNAYCQDNELSWIDWNLSAQQTELLEFVREIGRLRGRASLFRRETFLKGSTSRVSTKDVSWVHPSGAEMTDADWNDPDARALGIKLAAAREDQSDYMLLVNSSDHDSEFALPAARAGAAWKMLLDSSRPVAPGDGGGERPSVLAEAEHAVAVYCYPLRARSLAILEA